jgi:DNA repair photolyase
VIVEETTIGRVLTRSSGFLRDVCSHSLQPYQGCTHGNSLCGVSCYVRHNRWLTKGREWGSFLEARMNAAEAYTAEHSREQRWARRSRNGLVIFLSSSTDPFVPQERRLGLTAAVLAAMVDSPPDGLILQTHSPTVAEHFAVLQELHSRCDLRVQISVESDQERLPGLPAPIATVGARLAAAAKLHDAGLQVIICVAPLHPIAHPQAFFERISHCASQVIVDHFIGGDGTPDGRRTLATALPAAMAKVDPVSVELSYRDRMVDIACAVMPGRVGVSMDGFAGRWLES